MSTATTVNTRWTACVPSVDKAGVIHRTQTTRVQGVRSDMMPVGTTRLVYAGKHHLRPQSTALITVISFRTSARCNHHQRNTVRIQP